MIKMKVSYYLGVTFETSLQLSQYYIFKSEMTLITLHVVHVPLVFLGEITLWMSW